MKTWMVAMAVGVAALTGCRDAQVTRTAEERTLGPVTFARDVAPIVFEHCAPCHRPGGSAPFSLLDYDEARRRAPQIAEVTERRFMPPWLPEPGYGEFAGERRLSDGDIETIRRWVEEGALEGDAGADLPPPPRFTDGWQLGEPDLVVRLPRPYTLPAEGADIWRNFVIPIPVSETRFVRTVELRPGSGRIIHHALMAIDDTRSSRRRDEQDTEPGFEGMEIGDAHMPAGHLVGWTPGMLAFPGIDGTAWRLEPGTDAVLQIHMLPSGMPETVEPLIGFHFVEPPVAAAPLYLLRMDADEAIDIPAGTGDFRVADTFELPVDVEVLAAYPHAHYLGKRVEGWATLPDGTERRLIRINAWDFNWQDVYRYTRPVALPKGATIGMRWSYDNSAGNVRNPSHPPKRVVAGNRSSDEMAHLQLQVRLRRAEDLPLLQEAYYRHALGKNPANVWNHYSLGNALWDQGRLPEAIRQYRAALDLAPEHVATRQNLAAVLLEQGHAGEAIEHLRAVLRLEPDLADAHFNLGNALQSENRFDEAVRHYGEALRLEPSFAEAHNNLGRVLGSQGKLDEALAHFREAVRLNPRSAEAHNNLGAGLGLQGRLDEAIGHFRRALEIEPDHADARENLGLAIEQLNASRSGVR